MGQNTKIPWTDATLNPLSGCTKIKLGCVNCCALRSAVWISNLNKASADKYKPVLTESGEWNGEIRYHPKVMWEPDRWRKPRMIFLQIMGDLFHHNVDFKVIDEIYSAMKRNNKHIFQVLTKRPERRLEYYISRGITYLIKNIWNGISVSIQQDLYDLYPSLDAIPSTVKFVSFEPLLGHVSMFGMDEKFSFPDWIIIGGESGKLGTARIMNSSWATTLINEGKRYKIPTFMKQFGTEYAHNSCFEDKRGEDISEWPESFRIREYPPDINRLYKK